jgi:uncharacterized protein YjiS (DUF1127 family)
MPLLTFVPTSAPRFTHLAALAAGVIEALRTWRLRATSREQLARMNERELLDIGLTRAQAVYEASKSFWVA